MAEARERYRKLPGRLRGIVHGATVWLGSDHLLSVTSTRFREEYRRYHFRDIQAIVVATVPRWRISTRSITIAFLWGIAYLALASRAAWAPLALWAAAACLVVTWIYVSAACSCRCRIYTAVSRDELRSVYRSWTARRFLRAVEPHIVAVQGALASDWAEAVETRAIGPPDAPSPATAIGDRLVARPRTPATDVLIASLLADAVFNYVTLRSDAAWTRWILNAIAFSEIAAAILVFVQHYRGAVQSAMQKLAIAALAVMGVLFYVRPFLLGVTQATQQMSPAPPWALSNLPGYTLVRQVDAVSSAILGLVGVALSFRRR